MSMLPVGIGGRRRGYEIEKSLRFRAAASAYLSWTPAVPATSLTEWTFSCWFKRGLLTSAMELFNARINENNQTMIGIMASGAAAGDTLRVYNYISASFAAHKVSTLVLRDPSAWNHLVVAWDTSEAASDRVKIFLNGERITSFTTNTNPSTADTYVGRDGVVHNIGRNANNVRYFDGYVADAYLIDGQALTPNDFGQIDPVTGQWVPIAYTGTYGTNGFYLPFTDGSSLTTLGYDASGNNNDWTLNNISLTAGVTYDWMDDTPTNNFCVLNPFTLINSNKVFSEANLKLTSANGVQWADSSFVLPSGKWYFEMESSASGNYPGVGLWILGSAYSGQWLGYNDNGIAYYRSGNVFRNSSIVASYNTYTANDVIGVAFDADAGEIYFSKNGVWQGSSDPATATNPAATGLTGGIWSPSICVNQSSGSNGALNFGQRPFAHTPPTGFLALCTANLTSDDVIESGSFTGNANANGPFVWCNGTPETLTINSNAVTWGTHADRLANGFKLRTSSKSYNAAGTNNWTATVLSPESKSAFKNQRAKGNP